MTIAATATFQFNIGQICRMAYVDAGLVNVQQNPTAAQYSDALDKLQRIAGTTQTRGIFARVKDFRTITMAAGQSLYPLDPDVIDVISQGQLTMPGETIETPLVPISLEAWHELADKTTQGRPSMYYPNRKSDVLQVQIWQPPSTAEAGGTIRFEVHRLRADARDVNATMDFERYWTDYFVAELAYRLAKSNALDLGRCSLLRQDAMVALDAVRATSNERVGNQISIGHRSGWAGR